MPSIIPPSSEENSASEASAVVFRAFGEPRFHTDGEVLALAFGPDGSLWSVEEPGLLRQWDRHSGQPIRRHHLSDVETLWVFSDDATWLASASDDLSLWESATGKRVATIAQPSWVTTVVFSPHRGLVATGHDDGTIRLWDTATQQLMKEFPGHSLPVSALAFRRDGTWLASAGEDRDIHLWDVAAGKKTATLRGHTDRIPALTWNPQGNRLVSAGWDTTARVWDVATDEPVMILNSHADQVNALAFSPDGQMLACADSAETIHIWHAIAWKTLQVLGDPGEETRCLAFHPDGKLLASAGVDRMIHLWDPRKGELVSGHNGAARHSICVAATREGERLASTCGGTDLRVWDVATGRPAPPGEVAGILAVTASPDGRWLVGGTADYDARVQLWDAATGSRQLTMTGQRGAATALAIAPHSMMLASASASDGTVWLWNLATGEPALLIIEAADGCTVEALAFHPNGRFLAVGGIDWLATGGSDGAICLWDITQPAKVALFERGTTSLAFHPSGKHLAAASLDDVVSIWETDSHELVAELGGHKDGINCIAYSPDGRWLAVGGDDRTVRLWNADIPEPMAFHELDTPVKALCFSPDGRFLFTGNGNTTCYQLDVQRLLEE